MLTLFTKNDAYSYLCVYYIVDCEWGEWEFGECSQECGGGIQPTFRIKTQEAIFGGVECDGEGYGEQECNAQPCPGNIR